MLAQSYQNHYAESLTYEDSDLREAEEENYNAIFQRFYRAEEVAAEEGVGLGLYLARGIITRQNGYITVKSKKGEGSTFSVFLLS